MKWLTILLSIIILKGCGSSENTSKFKIKTNKKTFVIGDTLRISTKDKKNIVFDSVVYTLRGKRIELPYVFPENSLLGDYQINGTGFYSSTEYKADANVRLLNNKAPKLYVHTLINEFPHDTEAYIQGLEFDGDILYESTGLKGKSTLRRVNFKSGAVENKIDLDDTYFGEGLTILNGKIFQLTWQKKIGFIYDKETMQMEKSFNFDQSKEGWGLCNDGTYLYKSDGTSKIWKLDPQTQKELSYIEVTTHKTTISKINELEWVDGKIYANTYQSDKDVILIINPNNGAVEGILNPASLRSKVKQIPSLDVLNGIAYHKERGTFFITGKNWSKIFEVTFEEK